MSFLHYDFPQIAMFRHNKAIIEEQDTLIINGKAFVLRNASFNAFFHILDHTITLLSFVDLIFESRGDSKVCKTTLRNNFKV